MKIQQIYDENGELIFSHKFGWVSPTKFVSKLNHKKNEIIIDAKDIKKV